MSDFSITIGLFFTRGVGLSIWQRDGILARELTLFRALKARGIRTSLFAYDTSPRADLLNTPDEFMCVPISRAALSGRFRRFRSGYYAARAAVREVSLLRTNQFVGGTEACAAAAFFNTPLIARAGFIHSLNATLAGASAERVRVFQDEEQRLLTKSRAVVVTTARLRDYVCDTHGIAAEKVRVIGNLVPDYFHPEGKAAGRSEDRCRVLTIGRHHPEKGYDVLLEALAGEADVLWRAIGAGQDLAEDQVKARRAQVACEFTARIPNPEIPAELRAADIFVMTSQYEGHPKALIEAMACGVACVAVDAPGVGDEIENEVTGLVVPRAAGALREGIRRLRNDAELRQRLGGAAAEYIRSRYRLSVIVEKEVSLYRSILGIET